MIEREQMILELKERLEWLEQNAAENDGYAGEAEAIRQFLRKIEAPKLNLDEEYFSPQEATKRFWDTYETRMEIDHERQKILTGGLLGEGVAAMEASSEEPEAGGANIRKRKAGKGDALGNHEGGFFLYLARHKRFAVVAAAIMVVIILAVGGTAGAYAQSQMGIFSLFKKDEQGLAAVVNPEDEENADKDLVNEQRFLTIEEMPEEYKGKMTLPSDIYGEYYMEFITVVDTISYVAFEVCYNDGSDSNIFCYQQCFKEKETYVFQSYDGFILKKEKTIDGTKVNFYQGDDENKSRSMLIASFYSDNVLFVVECNLDIKIMEEFVKCILQQQKTY